MGNAKSFPETHVRIYSNLLGIQSAGKRAQMIQTILSSPEHLEAARRAGVYGNLLHYVQLVQAGSPPPLLPGEKGQGQGQQGQGQQGQQVAIRQQDIQKSQASEKGNDRAMNYFSACLRILELEEEVALTEAGLKSAYKKAIIRAHPDKGGSEKEFEAVTRAYAYLGEILKRIHGGRKVEGKMEAPTALAGERSQEADKWKMVEPVALNPKNLNTKAFNEMFEKTRIPDPEEAGYGDWLKAEDSSSQSAPKFSGKFNRDVFNQAFADDSKGKAKPRASAASLMVQEQQLANRLGYATELGRSGRDDYTAANDDRLQFTDLKKAYTEYNTFSQEVSDVRVEARTFDQYSKSRKEAPPPLADHEMAALQAAEKQALKTEEQRKLRLAQEAVQEDDYFSRMKRLVIRNN